MLTMCVVRDNACWYYHFTLHIQLSGALLPIVGLHHRPLSHIIHCVMLWGGGGAARGGADNALFNIYFVLCAIQLQWLCRHKAVNGPELCFVPEPDHQT